MTKTIDEQLERLASAQERSADALESIYGALRALLKPNAETVAAMAEGEDDAGTDDDEPATEEAAVEEAQVEVAEEAEAEEQQPEPEPEPNAEDEPGDAAEAEAGDAPGDEGDPLGDGDAAVDEPELPAKLTNDTLRGFARNLMEKEGKAAVFEVLAEVGKGYKAVGEVPKEDLKEAHLKMAARLKG